MSINIITWHLNCLSVLVYVLYLETFTEFTIQYEMKRFYKRSIKGSINLPNKKTFMKNHHWKKFLFVTSWCQDFFTSRISIWPSLKFTSDKGICWIYYHFIFINCLIQLSHKCGQLGDVSFTGAVYIWWSGDYCCSQVASQVLMFVSVHKRTNFNLMKNCFFLSQSLNFTQQTQFFL